MRGLSGPDRRVVVQPVPVPWDCSDGFLAAYWRRPHSYLDDDVRAGMSGVAALPSDVVRQAVRKLAEDLSSGKWQRGHRDLLGRDSLDVGYRLVVATSALSR